MFVLWGRLSSVHCTNLSRHFRLFNRFISRKTKKEKMITTQNLTQIGIYTFDWLDSIGTIQAITEDRNGNPMSNLLVSRDDVSNKTTNNVGVAEYNLSKTCQQNMEFKVYCSNTSGAQLCDTKTAKLDVVNDYEGLRFDCSICSSSPDMQIDVDNIGTNKATNQFT